MPASSNAIAAISAVSVPVLSAAIGGALVLLFFANYLCRRRSEVVAIAAPTAEIKTAVTKPSKTSAASSRKLHHRSHHPQFSARNPNKKHHPRDVNTLKGHSDSVTGLCFSSDGRNLATVCTDGVVRIFRIDDASSKSFKILKINLPAGAQPTAITFSEGATTVVVAASMLTGSSLFLYGDVSPLGSGGAKAPLPEIRWEHHKVHGTRAVLTLFGASAIHGSADGSTIIASCSDGTDIKLWHGKSGRELGTVDTNQLKNHMATLSPNGRFLAAAAFTADVKVWEVVYSKDGSVKEVSKVMQLKGHKHGRSVRDYLGSDHGMRSDKCQSHARGSGAS